MIEDRLVDIETKISFQEDLIEELNKTLYQQQQKLDQLEEICRALARHVQALAEAGNEGKSPSHERPPHY
ncbi:MAG TPA: SlyX family protein [Sideroxyarcus sp.]|nr:SlyX family protein [Sideroxyarcus sp.]